MRGRGTLQVRVYALVVAISITTLALPATAGAQKEQPPATPDPNFAGTFNGSEFDGQPMLKKKCVDDAGDSVESKAYEVEGWDAATQYERYPGSCVSACASPTARCSSSRARTTSCSAR